MEELNGVENSSQVTIFFAVEFCQRERYSTAATESGSLLLFVMVKIICPGQRQ